MLSYCIGTVNDLQWGFKLVLSYSKPWRRKRNAFTYSTQATKDLDKEIGK